MPKLNKDIAIVLLQRMLTLKIWKSNHIRWDTIKHCGFPKHVLGEVDKTIELLIKKEFIIYYNKAKKAIQLNWDKIKEIMEFVEH